MVWRETPALRGGGFELLLHYNWIKKGWGLLSFGPWAVEALQHQAAFCSNIIFRLWLQGVVSSVHSFQ